MIELTNNWKASYPAARIGILALENVTNPDHSPELEVQKRVLEADLRDKHSGSDRSTLKSLPVIQAYVQYYKQFKKSYHVLLQLESIVLGGKSLPRGAALVEAMFMAELKNLLLTAGHDHNLVAPPVTVQAASGDEVFTRINGNEQGLKKGDMNIQDQQGVLSSVIYGPDARTRITSSTSEVLFTTYAPTGISAELVDDHLHDILANVRLFAPAAQVRKLEVYRA